MCFLTLDGTLVDTAPDLIGALNHVMTLNRLSPIPSDHMRPFVGHGGVFALKRGFAYHQQDIDDDHLALSHKQLLEHYVANISATSRPFPGAEMQVRRMRNEGIRLGICTNKKEHMSLALLSQLRLEDLFHAICGADSVTNHKPHQDHIVETIERAGGDIGSSILIGDTKTDVDAAKAANIPVILLSHGYTPTPVHDLGADLVIDHFNDLQAGLTRLSKS